MFRLVLLTVLLSLVAASNVKFVNRCGYNVNVIRTANNQAPASEGNLGPGQSFTRSYSSNGMNFKNGWNGLTLAEFSWNSWNGLDFYDLSVIVGYDIAMQIRPSTGGPTVTCTYKQCPDAYQYPSDDTKTHGTRTGGSFTLTFCP
ncbi:hypothetical protein L596_013851 [Steinernema carpocapsae]|uniref:Thaumatin-like protein n=1 Tax=Steinernema carpocapsae TaxID=34508 RepID=A0A4U5P2R1_STECR|nr:hypothetical protein L596_013851 [Steinernema carpocapsae]